MPLNLESVKEYVEQNIGEFHKRRLDKVQNLELKEVLLSKNPYLFKAKNVTQASEIVESILAAYISSSEEGLFGNWLERLAIFINDSVFSGRKGAGEGIDLDFDREGVRYLVAIKSGPNWANGDQLKKLIDQFATIKKRLSTSGAVVNVVCVNGCCYGRSNLKSEYKKTGGYLKVCGQRFWELISGEADLYTRLIEPLGHEAEARNAEYNEHYGALVNKLVNEFFTEFCNKDTGVILWDKLVKFNSGPLEDRAILPKKAAKKRIVKKSVGYGRLGNSETGEEL